jgi:hypothetical protein
MSMNRYRSHLARLRRKQKKAGRRGWLPQGGQVSQADPDGPVVVLDANPAIRKMSEMLLKVAEPLLEGSDDDAQYRGAIDAAVIGWNLAVAPQEFKPRLLEELNARFGEQTRQKARECLEMLAERKRRLFPKEERLIMDYRLTGRGEKMNLLVLSAFV